MKEQQNESQQNLTKEKLFQNYVPRSRVQLDIVKNIRDRIEELPSELPEKIISYHDVIKENGEYYLLYNGSSELETLVEYLYKNSISSEKLLKEYRASLSLLKQRDDLDKLFPEGINAENFWIDKEENIYLMPEAFLQIKRNYGEFEVEIPGSDYFVSPEIISGEDWSQSSYIFNLTAVFYYFLSGRTIFEDADNAKVLNKIQTEKILELKKILPELSSDLNELFQKGLLKEKEERAELNYLIEKLKDEEKDNNFKLDPLLERKKRLNNSSIKNKNRIENVKLFFRQSWKVILFFVIVGGGFVWGLTSGPPPTINSQNTSQEVVNYFYQGLATKNINLTQEAADFELGEMGSLIMESHVIEKMQQAYDRESSDKKENSVYSLEELDIKNLSTEGEKHEYRASYEFNFRDSGGRYSVDLVDELVLEKVDGVWRITTIKGDFSSMIKGNYPWRDKNGKN